MVNEIFLNANDLPEKLSEEAIKDNFLKLKSGDLEARNKIIKHNIRLVLYCAHRFSEKAPIEDLVSIGTIALIKAVDTFDINKNIKFSTYAIRCINNEILMHLRKLRKYPNEISIDEAITNDNDGNECTLAGLLYDENANFSENIDRQCLYSEIRKVVDNLSDINKKIILLYFGFYNDIEYNQYQISQIVGLSQSYVSRIINRTVNQIKKELEQRDLIPSIMYQQKKKQKDLVKNKYS